MTGAQLKAKREAAGMTRTELAAAMGIVERTVYRLENEETPISRTYQIILEQVLPVKVGAKTPRTGSPRSKIA